MSHEYPRRRDVRERLLDIYEVLHANFDDLAEDFDRDFLTEVRDLMRDGIDLETAVVVVAGDPGEGSFFEGDEMAAAQLAADFAALLIPYTSEEEADEYEEAEAYGIEDYDY